ncbi:PilW family protein [Ramlibacter sp.]|uniref:PilW family protein n=1 Tax=Ramlibacter sp. TaxID=1917967 RepID=UPI0018099EF8|nr:PilW family protein [Ramlibacter sp.]MBA2674665.1 PilW family protein [Ramlibacter sp.]
MNNPRLSASPRARRHARGMSLIELMIAGTIGLLVVLAVTGSVMTMGRQFSILGSNATAQSSAQIGISLIDAAGRAAGAGFYNNGKSICSTWNAYNGTAVVADNGVLMPVRITAGASGTVSDTITFTAGGGSHPLSSLPVLEAASGNSIKVTDAGNIAAGDLAVIGVPGSTTVPCTLFQVIGAPTTAASCGGNAPSCRVLVRNPNNGLNPNPTDFTTTPTYGYDTAGSTVGPAVVSRIGTSAGGFRQDAFAVQCNALVRYNAFTTTTVPACTANPLAFGTGVDAVATDIVMLQAQYGISASAADNVVASWVEPTGTWASPAAGDVARIKAIRVVLVARSRDAEGTQISAPCTNAASVANTGPCSFQDAAAPVIDLSGLALPTGKTWRNYRYRVHKAVIPLRNVIWSNS